MARLSRRGQALVDSPPLAAYIREHFSRVEQAWDATERPDGYIALCIAENARRAADLLGLFEGYRNPPPGVLGYDSMVGNLEFRRNLAAFLGRTLLGRDVAAEQLAVVAGAGSVLELLFYAIADRGDAVLIPTPSYAGFWADLETRDALAIVPVDCPSDADFLVTTDRLDAAMDASEAPVRALLFTSPDNPLGRVYSREKLLEILNWADSRDIHVVFDEVYGLSVFGPQPFVSAASLRSSLGERTHVVWAFSKDFGASGLRCGALISENEAVLGAVDQLAYWSACSGHTQYLLSRLVSDTEAVDGYLSRMRSDLAQTHHRVGLALDAAGIPFRPADAGFFVVCDLRAFLERPTIACERALWRGLLEGANVNLTPGEACRISEPGFFRLCYAGVELAAVELAIERLGRALARR